MHAVNSSPVLNQILPFKGISTKGAVTDLFILSCDYSLEPFDFQAGLVLDPGLLFQVIHCLVQCVRICLHGHEVLTEC